MIEAGTLDLDEKIYNLGKYKYAFQKVYFVFIIYRNKIRTKEMTIYYF